MPKTPQLQGKKQGECHMCGLTKELSKEHFFPIWMREYQPIEQVGMINYTTGVEKTREVGTFTVNQICKDCNSGWMAKLQDAAKPIIAPRLISGPTTKLTVDEGRILAQWYVMTTMVCEKDNPGGFMGVSADQRREFAASQIVPDDWQIWIGRWPTPPSRGFSHLPGKVVNQETGETVGKTQSTVMLAGRLMLLSFSGYPAFYTAHLGSWKMNRIFPSLDDRSNPPLHPFPIGFLPRILIDVIGGKVTTPASAAGTPMGTIPIHKNVLPKV